MECKCLKASLIIICFLLANLVKASINNSDTSCKNGHETITNTFSWVDYLVLSAMLIVSCGIGVFYGFIGKKQETSNDFLLGGSSMGTFPMAMSLAASFVTAVELLGNPAEMYVHGSQFWIIILAFIIVVPLTSKFYLPVFMTLRLTSSYEYLSMRFSPKTRYLASGLYILQMILYTSVAVYAPALALSHVTGLNVYLAVSVVYVVCIFYASQGGMKAVIIADTFQAGVLIGSIILIAHLGASYIGDTGLIWSDNYSTNRLELFNLNPNMTIRHSFWSVVIGGTFYWMTMFCSNQASIQKYLSVENISQVRKALWTSCFGLILIYTINFYTGMIMVAHYKDCDPLSSGMITASDEILPLYIISVMGHLKGVTGFFVAGIFAASLGTVASALNSLAAVTMQDFIAGAMEKHVPDSRGALCAKCLSIMYGAISFGLVFIVAQLGSVMQVAISFNGMVGGVTLGLFTLGMFFPWANSKGAIFGSLVAMAFVAIICIGQQISIANGMVDVDQKPVSIENCPCLNETETRWHTTSEDLVFEDEVFSLFKISYIWNSAIGFVVTVVMGLIGSLITGPQDPHDVDADFISPPILNFYNSLSNKTKEFLNLPKKHCSGEREVAVVNDANITLDVYNRFLLKTPTVTENLKQKIRKISAPS